MEEQNRKLEIIDKIMKLMELGNAEKNSNVNEVEAAKKMVAKLMADYSIDFIDLKTHKPKGDAFVTITVEGSEDQKVDYEASLAHVIAKAFDCRIINIHENKLNDGSTIYDGIWRLCFLGSKHDLEIVIYFFKFLRRTMGTMSNRNVTKETIKADNPMLGRRITEAYINQARYNYCYGMVNTLDDRLMDLYAKREEFIPSDCRAMVLVKKDDLEKFVHEKFPRLTHSRSRRIQGDIGAYQKGMADGKKVNLTRPIDSNQVHQQLN